MRAALVVLSCALIVRPSASAQIPERIVEIRVHGNHTTPDAEIVALSGLATGEEAGEARLRAAERRLRDTGRFEGVELRVRYLSIADPSQILIMIVVDEHPAISASDLTPGPMKKIASAGMWLPILRYEEGYGLTYGARYSFNDAFGDRSRASVPLTWGGERRVAVEAERLFDGPISVLRGGLLLQRRVNPHFALPDTRREARVEAERIVTDWLRIGAGARVRNVKFGDAYDARHIASGVQAVFDTRIDPSFPRNAVHASLEWERLAFPGGGAHRWRADIRGYIDTRRSWVVAVRGQLATSNTALPFAEHSLLGGGNSLRGYPAGHRAGDNLAAGTIELRQPLNSPLSVGRFGIKTFLDAGTTWAAGTRIGNHRFDHGIGGGAYFGAGPFIMDLDVAWPEQGKPRTHIAVGISF